ncbi:MAG: hypothetical protein NVSMB9_25510 [Isosphaeraceae bacterium]
MNPFFDACGGSEPLLLRLETPGTPGGESRGFDLPFVIVGREARADLRLSDPEVCDRHAYLQLVGGQLLYVDLGSRLGIYQTGKCQRLGYVDRDRAIRIGPYRIRLISGDDDRGTARLDGPPLTLELLHRSVRQTRCELPGGLALVGSASDCAVRLVDPSVSNYHCSLVHTPRGVWVVDLLGRGGLRVNGQEVSYARLYGGDAISLGRSVIRLSGDDLSPASNPGHGSSGFAESLSSESRGSAPSSPPAPSSFASRPVLARLAEVEEEGVPPFTQRDEGELASMAGQLGLLQRQMVEEFQQARTMMYEMVATLQREQADFLEHEFAQLRDLRQELQILRADLQQQRRLLTERSALELSPTRLGSAVASTSQGVEPDASDPGAFPSELDHAEALNDGTVRARPGPAPAGPRAFVTPDRKETSIRHDSKSVDPHHEQIHVVLCERIARMKDEHQSRWKMFLSLLPGTV